MDQALRARTAAPSTRPHRLAYAVTLALHGALACVCMPALAIGPGPVAGPINVSSGTEQVFGSTDVTSTGTDPGANVTGGTLVIDVASGPMPNSIRFSTQSGNVLQASGTGTIQVIGGPRFKTVSGHAVLANGPDAFISLGGASLFGTGTGGGLIA